MRVNLCISLLSFLFHLPFQIFSNNSIVFWKLGVQLHMCIFVYLYFQHLCIVCILVETWCTMTRGSDALEPPRWHLVGLEARDRSDPSSSLLRFFGGNRERSFTVTVTFPNKVLICGMARRNHEGQGLFGRILVQELSF